MVADRDVPDPARGYAERDVEDTILAILGPGASAARRRIILTGAPGNGARTILLHRLPARLGARAHALTSETTESLPAADVLLLDGAEELHRVGPEQFANCDLVVIGALADFPAWFRRDQYVEVVEVPPLSLTELPGFLLARLGDEVDLVSASDLGRATGFVPRFLTVLLRELQRSGGLVHTGGRWRLATPLTGNVLATRASRWLLDLDPQSITVLRRISFEETVSEHLLPPQEVSVLERHGFIHRPRSGYVSMRSPLLAETIRALAPAAEAAERFRAALDRGQPSFAAVKWALEHHHAVTREQLGSVLTELQQRHDWGASIELIELALPSCPVHDTPDLLRRLAHAWRFRGNDHEADAALTQAAYLTESLPEHTDTDALRTRIVAARADLAHYGRGDREEALKLLHRSLQGRNSESHLGFLTTQQLLHLVYGGAHSSFMKTYEDSSTRNALAHASREDRARVRVASCLALTATGEPKRGYRRALRIKAETGLQKHLGSWLSEELNATIFVCAISSSGPERMHAIARTLDSPVTPATPPTENLAFDLARASWFYHAGNIPRARLIAEQAAAAGTLRDPSGFAAALNALRANLAALTGRYPHAGELLDAQYRTPLSSSASIAGGIQANLAASRFLLGEPEAHSQLLAQAEAFIGEGHFGFAAEVLHTGIRFGETHSAELLRSISHRLDGELHRTRTLHATALIEEDALALARVAAMFRDLGLPLFAAESYGQVLSVSGSKVPERVRRSAEKYGRRLCAGIDAPGHEALRRFAQADASCLTPREAQVQELIHAGLSNNEIAARLHLSPRTVEGHVTRLYQKTGHTRRARVRSAG